MSRTRRPVRPDQLRPHLPPVIVIVVLLRTVGFTLVLGIALVLLAPGYDAAKLPALLAGIVAVAVTASSRLSRGLVKVTTTDRR